MTYLINKWSDSYSVGTSCIFRTNNLEEWLKGIVKAKKKYHIKESECRWQESGIDEEKIVVFSFCTDSEKNFWKSARYTRKPNFIFMGFPEGIKYYE